MKSSAELPARERRSIDQSKIVYQKPQPVSMVPDIFIGAALELPGDAHEWPRSRRPPHSGRSF